MIKNNIKEALKEGSVLKGVNFRYRILKVLGLGSYGITYLADIINEAGERTNMQVALKELFVAECNDRKDSTVSVFSNKELFDQLYRKFKREAQNLHSISHNNLLNVYEGFEANDTAYYSMSYISGESLADIIKTKGRIPEKEALEITIMLAGALDELHSHGLLHLDVRPDNILMNSGKVPVLIDFGLAKHFDEKGEPDTIVGLGNGESGYVPMEQTSYHPGFGVPKTMDIYALGATLYNMLTGKVPPSAPEIFNYGFSEDELAAAGVSRPTIEIVTKAMQPLWKDRYQSAAHLEKAIKIALDGESDKPEPVAESAEVIPVETVMPSQPIPEMINEEATAIDYQEDEATSLEVVSVSGGFQNERTTVDLENTSLDIMPAACYQSDERTRVEEMPAFPAQSYNVTGKDTSKKNRTLAFLLIGLIIAIIGVMIATDFYTGWIRELFRTPVECVVLEAD